MTATKIRKTPVRFVTSPELLPAASESSTSVYELRVYHTYEGKLDDLLRRYREHRMRAYASVLFVRRNDVPTRQMQDSTEQR